MTPEEYLESAFYLAQGRELSRCLEVISSTKESMLESSNAAITLNVGGHGYLTELVFLHLHRAQHGLIKAIAGLEALEGIAE